MNIYSLKNPRTKYINSLTDQHIQHCKCSSKANDLVYIYKPSLWKTSGTDLQEKCISKLMPGIRYQCVYMRVTCKQNLFSADCETNIIAKLYKNMFLIKSEC